jgi:methionyl-tRNA formyltransferase
MGTSSVIQKPLRVVFCTCPSVYSDIVLQELIKSTQLKLVGVVASSRVLRKKGWNWWDVFLLIHRTSLRYAAYLWMVTSLYTIARRLKVHDAVRDHLSGNRIPVYTTRDINQADGIAFLKGCQADLVLSAHFNQLIGPELLGIPAKGCLNIHPGMLPEYKGVDPVIHAMFRETPQVGVTVHFQDQGFDTGPVVVAGSIPVKPDDSLYSLNCALFRLGISKLLSVIGDDGMVPEGTPQATTENYDSWPNRILIRKMRANGRKLIKILSYLALIHADSV